MERVRRFRLLVALLLSLTLIAPGFAETPVAEAQAAQGWHQRVAGTINLDAGSPTPRPGPLANVQVYCWYYQFPNGQVGGPYYQYGCVHREENSNQGRWIYQSPWGQSPCRHWSWSGSSWVREAPTRPCR